MNELAIIIGGTPIPAPTELPHGGFPSGQRVIQVGIELMLVAAATLALIVIIWSGIQWIVSGGEKTALENARKRLTYAVIGLIVALLGLAIIQFIGTAVGTQLLGP